MDVQQRNQAVGNLLAALIPAGPTQTATNGPLTNQLSPTNGKVENIEPAQEKQEDDSFTQTATESISNPPLPTDPDLSLPPLPPLLHNDFIDSSMGPSLHSIIPDDGQDDQQHFAHLGDLPMDISGHPEAQQPFPNLSHEMAPERREIEAFAKIEFEDGNYYITTYACELGRDAFAYRAALQRAEESRQAEQNQAQSSSGRRSEAIPRPENSQVQGSVVSEAGGFGGVDERPGPNGRDKDEVHHMHSHSSEPSAGSVVKPQEVLINPPLIPFDYHKMAELQAQAENENALVNDTEQPAPVTADHIPDAHNCPLIPIHAMRNFQKSEVENHRSISRRHVKIQWDFDKDCFMLKVLGRNGAFLDDQYLQRAAVKRLRDGSRIQISNVWMTFRLPNQKASPISDESEREDKDRNSPLLRSTSPTSNEQDRSISPSRTGKTRTKITLTTGSRSAPVMPDPLVGPDGQPLPPRKRGPGRPPKDGIMSTRERREREKALKLAEAKAANGGTTPPPNLKGKFPKPIIKEEVVKEEPKAERRKYKKRKRPGEDGDIVQSIEGGEVDIPSEAEKPPVKKARASKSPSPEYPPADSLTEEQLARPSEPYARLIYDILLDIHPKALPLKQIYRALKLKFPFFVHRVDSEGWQSSVRHNLNQEWNKLFEKGEKEGKGFAWKAIPGALQPQAERRRAAQQAAAAKPKPAPAPRQHPQGPPPPLNWQNSTPYSQPNGMPPRGPPPPFFIQGPHGPVPPPPNGMPWPPPPPGSVPPPASSHGNPPPRAPNSTSQPFYAPTQSGIAPFPPQQASQQAGQQTGPPRSTPSVNQPTAPGPSSALPPTSSVPPPSTSSSASRNMPCTLDGIVAIGRFESAMYEQVGDPEKIARWRGIFQSVKRRLLHGAPHSLMPEGDTREEETIMSHVRTFINRFKNPAFIGFSIDPGSSNASPAPNPPANAAPVSDKNATPQAALTVQPVNGSQESPKESSSDSKSSIEALTTQPAPAKANTSDFVQDSETAKIDSAQTMDMEGAGQGLSESQDADKKTESLPPTSATSA
ncbi:uncharacterized protein A1O9_00420 [Exophiala aquamarina CBS 119918]|uniref:Fork-head domain-containing protein n=1 Tax=Exophiala aquamarina CBS 119918 TaxID=1182545 RepID=A0A072PSY3_9EURO|nr:uncharacterized protein A1O9_00420 [Exophiala aquamarina CBS 119918]KEF62448.1 hypothetical protein A1O9_00420 [Exophiala aquamarina CBS 119918]